jgi:hypothetical protein
MNAPANLNIGIARHTRLRRLAALVLALFIASTMTVLPAVQSARADDDDRRVSGTVLRITDNSLKIAGKNGLKLVYIDSATEIVDGDEPIRRSDIHTGDKASARVVQGGDGRYTATKLRIRNKSRSKKIEHITGVVIERGDHSFTIAKRDGRPAKVHVDDDEEAPEIADVVTAIVEEDVATGDLQAMQIELVEQIVRKLEASLASEINEAKAEVLRKIIDESARQHLDVLNQTLDEVEAEAQEKIEAALEKFRTDYAAVAERVGNAPPEESYTGVISELTGSTITISSTTGDGSRTFEITGETGIVIEGVDVASLVDLVLGQMVTVSFIPEAEGSVEPPLALVMTAQPPALPPEVTDAIDELSDGVVTGEITIVEDDGSGEVVIVITDNETGETVGVSVTPESNITIDGQSGSPADLEPEQNVEVTVADDGVTAENVVVDSGKPVVGETQMSGMITGIDPTRRVILVAPPSGAPLRLTVVADAVITLNGAVTTLNAVQLQGVVLETSRYMPGAMTVSRLALARTVQTQQATSGGSVTPTPTPTPAPASPSTFTVRGFMKTYNADYMVVDGISLPTNIGISMPESVPDGSEVDMLFRIEPDGRIVLVGIQPAQ